ncbi:MAG: GspL/Epsl periplasmic domain-containing protein [Candidatus Brocadiia bacterium]
MANRSIGIDVGRQEIRAVQMICRGRRTRVERALSCPLPAPGEPAGSAATALRELLAEGGFRRRVASAVAAPPGAVFFHRHQTELSNLQQARRVLPFELEDELPLAFGDAVLDICTAEQLPDGGYDLLVGAVDRDILHRRADVLRKAGMPCDLVDAEVCALLTLTLASHPEAADGAALVAEVREERVIMGLARDGRLLNARSLARPPEGASPDEESASETLGATLARELQLTWRQACRGALPEEATVFLAARQGLQADLGELLQARLAASVRALDPTAGVTLEEGVELGAEDAVALGLALRAAGKGEGPDFLRADRATAEQARARRRAGFVLVALLVLVSSAWLVRLFMRLGRLERRNEALESRIEQTFRQTLPDQPHMVDPVVQVRRRLEELRREYERFASVTGRGESPLRLLRQISVALPRSIEVRVTELNLSGRTVTMQGITDSLKSLDALQASLSAEPLFSGIRVKEVSVGSGNAVRFTVEINLKPI